MKKFTFLLFIIFATFFSNVNAQVQKVSLAERIENSAYVVIGSITEKHGFWDKAHERLNTLNVIEVDTYLKGSSTNATIAVITEGGQVGLQAVVACPSDALNENKQYVFFLKNEEVKFEDQNYKTKNPQILQTKPHYIHAMLPFHNGRFYDLFEQFSYTKTELLSILKNEYKLDAVQLNHKAQSSRVEQESSSLDLLTITSVTDGTGTTPAAFIAGTMVANNEIIFNGSGFGAVAGTIEFTNANNPGTTTALANVSDLISWSNTQIRAKIPRLAGTGNVTIKNNLSVVVGTVSITIDWAEICLDDPARDAICATVGSSLRHRIELINQDGTGGYLFRYNNNSPAGDFSANTAAKAAFERAINTWRCATLVNFSISPTPIATGFNAGDAISVVLFDNTLPANVLGICYTGYGGSCSSGCANGVRWVHSNMDIRILPIPYSGTTWNYNIAAPTLAEYDFESVMVHELGHAHGLGHVVDAAKVMHYAIANGVAKRTLSSAEINGGLFKMVHSTAIQCVGTNRMIAIAPGGCGFTYTFNGNGNWNTASNWAGGFIPPTTLTAGYEIIIDPIVGGECLLQSPYTQIIGAGAKLTVKDSKKFRVIGNLLSL
jgi:hypothetical protein